MFHTLLSVRLMPMIGEMLLLGSGLSLQCLDEPTTPGDRGSAGRRCSGKSATPGVIAEFLVTRPVLSSKLHEGQLVSSVKHTARYRPGSAEILAILVSLCGRRGHTKVLRAEQDSCQRIHSFTNRSAYSQHPKASAVYLEAGLRGQYHLATAPC